MKMMENLNEKYLELHKELSLNIDDKRLLQTHRTFGFWNRCQFLQTHSQDGYQSQGY